MADRIELEDVPCPMGCRRDDEFMLKGRDRLHELPGEFDVVKCQVCGLLRTNPRPTRKSIGIYYPDDYGPYVGTQIHEAQIISKKKKIIKSIARFLVNFNTQPMPAISPGKMLEIGCASGAFLHQMAGQGWRVQGIEFSAKAAQAAAQRGYLVHAGPLEEAALALDERFDLIVGWMVLEHLHDPIRALRQLRELAKPEAWLVLSVPNANSLEFRMFKENWYSLHLPNHLFHFTPETIASVLRSGGWSLEKISYHRVVSNFIVSFGYVLNDNNCTALGGRFIKIAEKGGAFGAYALYPFAWLLAHLRQTDRMTVWARLTR